MWEAVTHQPGIGRHSSNSSLAIISVNVCVRLRGVKHSNTERLRQEGTVGSTQLHGHNTGTVIRTKPEDIFELPSAHKRDMDF